MRIILTGGGSGGHLFPLIAVSRKLKEKLNGDAEFLYIGSGADIEKTIMETEGIKIKNVQSGKIRRYFALENIIDFFRIPIGIFQSLWILLNYMPEAVFSKGGYAAVPVVIAAWIYRIPVLIHESDAMVGLANRFSASFATRIAVSYPSSKGEFPESKTAITGNPVRRDLIGGDPIAARKRFNFTESKPVVLVIGGSQGAWSINNSIIRILPELLHRAQIIHQTGKQNYEEVIHSAAEYGIKVGRDGYAAFPFMDTETLRDAFALADLVISRAGANSIVEIAANKKTAILVPLETAANNHQRVNAYEVAQTGGAMILEEANMTPHMFIQKIESILDNKELAKDMAEKLSKIYRPDADEMIANGILEMIK